MFPLLALLAAPLLVVATNAETLRVGTDDALRQALASAAPGTRIALAPGTYRGFSASNLQGTAERPIVITAEDPAAAPKFSSGVHLSDAAHVVLEHFTIVGAPANGLNIDDGGTFETPSHHVTLRHLTIRDGGGSANHDGIKLSGVVDFTLDSCTVERWGRGGSAVDMVGCHRGTIDHCTIRDSEATPASNGVQTKGGSRDIVIRHCRFEHAGQRAVNIGGSTGREYFRPKLTGKEDAEASSITVEGCTFIGSLAPIAFVGVDGANVRFNTFFRPAKWFMRILQETRDPGFVACRNGTFTDNLVVYRAADVTTAVNIGPDTAPETFTFARNYWFCVDAPKRSIPTTLPRPETDPAGGADPLFIDSAAGDLRLRPESPARAYGAEALPSSESR